MHKAPGTILSATITFEFCLPALQGFLHPEYDREASPPRFLEIVRQKMLMMIWTIYPGAEVDLNLSFRDDMEDCRREIEVTPINLHNAVSNICSRALQECDQAVEWRVLTPGEKALGDARIPIMAAERLETQLIDAGMDANVLRDLKVMIGYVGISPGEPGTLAQTVISKTIEEFEGDVEVMVGPQLDALTSGDMDAVREEVAARTEEELLLLDIILWAASVKDSKRH
jgi:hypothetical protein